MSKTTDALKGSYIRVESREASVEVQQLLFKLGFRWINEDREIKKDVPMYFPGWIYVDTNCRIWQDRINRYKGVTSGQDFGKFKEVDKLNIMKAVIDYAEEKRQKKRASRLKKKGWIENKGFDPAIKEVDIVFSGGEQGLNCASHFWSWSIYGQDCDIAYYRPSNQHPPQQKSKWTKWVADESSEYPGNPKDFVEIVYNDGLKTTGSARGFFWDKRECPADDIRKYRVVKAANTVVPVSFEEMVNDIVKDAVEVVEKPVDSVGDVNSDARGSGARYNAGKPDLSLIPLETLAGEAKVWEYGAKKYSRNNWKKGMAWSIPLACALRHLAAWQKGETNDPETGENHLDHVMCNIRMLKYYAEHYPEGDDRS